MKSVEGRRIDEIVVYCSKQPKLATFDFFFWSLHLHYTSHGDVMGIIDTVGVALSVFSGVVCVNSSTVVLTHQEY